MALDPQLPDASNKSSAEVVRKAALTVCEHSTDIDDAAQLLDMLGLLARPELRQPS